MRTVVPGFVLLALLCGDARATPSPSLGTGPEAALVPAPVRSSDAAGPTATLVLGGASVVGSILVGSAMLLTVLHGQTDAFVPIAAGFVLVWSALTAPIHLAALGLASLAHEPGERRWLQGVAMLAGSALAGIAALAITAALAGVAGPLAIPAGVFGLVGAAVLLARTDAITFPAPSPAGAPN